MMDISAVLLKELRLVRVFPRTDGSILDGSRDLEMAVGVTTLLQRDTISELNESFQVSTTICCSSITIHG